MKTKTKIKLKPNYVEDFAHFKRIQRSLHTRNSNILPVDKRAMRLYKTALKTGQVMMPREELNQIILNARFVGIEDWIDLELLPYLHKRMRCE